MRKLQARRVGFAAAACLSLALSATQGTAQVKLRIDPAKGGPAVDPFVFGQFIEHLGRCIYGGIWAEMVQDRKFLLPVEKSPWKKTGLAAEFEVKQDPAGEFAGVPCLALWLRQADGQPHGIRQSGLGVISGKEYVGSIWLASLSDPVSVAVGLDWGKGPDDGVSTHCRITGPAYRRFEFRFKAGATTEDAALTVSVEQRAYVWIGAVSLMPAENVRGMRPDTLSLIRAMAPPLIRWPGGNFVSGYRWKDGIGPRDRRPPRYERAWNDIEPNDFGIDEFMDFAREIGTEPYICVNSGLGSLQDALDELEYANGPASSRWGSMRAKYGHPDPYRIRVWGIGNEMYGDWQLGNVSVQQYALRHIAYAETMRAADPAIRIIGVGTPGVWNDGMLPAAPYMNWLSEHYYQERKFKVPLSSTDLEAYSRQFPGYAGTLAHGIRELVDAFRSWQVKAGEAGSRVRLAIDEWGIVRDWNVAPDSPGLGSLEHYYTLGDGLDVARGLHEILRSTDVVTMANWAQTVNVIGLIKTSRTAASMEPPGRVLELYRRHFGDLVIPVDVEAGGLVDVVASRSRDGSVLCVAMVNSSLSDTVLAEVTLPGSVRVASARIFRIDGPSIGAINTPGRAENVALQELAPASWRGALDLPPHSVTLAKLQLSR
jgi:alpha-N-arabinofuranosidase